MLGESVYNSKVTCSESLCTAVGLNTLLKVDDTPYQEHIIIHN